MTITSGKLALALNDLPFVQVVEDVQQDKAITVLCRIRPGSGGTWAALAERILREAQKREGTPEYWHTHIARSYMLRDGRMVYGWIFVVQALDLDKAIPLVAELIYQFSSVLMDPQRGQTTQPRKQQQNGQPRRPLPDNEDDDPPDLNEDDDFSEPETPMPKGYVPEADAMGNPIVPREHRIRQQAMAGLPSNYDRNAPDPDKGKGSWNIESRKGKPFRPPVRR